jgi:hypothetical protein
METPVHIEPRVLSIQEAITELAVLADTLDEQPQPLRSAKHPGIVLDQHQIARLVRLFFTTHGVA